MVKYDLWTTFVLKWFPSYDLAKTACMNNVMRVLCSEFKSKNRYSTINHYILMTRNTYLIEKNV